MKAELPSTIGVVDDPDIPMETDENTLKQTDNKKYYIDTNMIKVPRKGMEMTTFLKDGMSK